MCTGKVFALFDENLQAAEKDKEEKERLKVLQAEEKVRKIPEYVPTEATIKQLFAVQQVELCSYNY